MYLLTEWEGRTGKYLARGQDVRTERSEVRASLPRAKYYPVRPDLTQSISILSILRNSLGKPVSPCIGTTSCLQIEKYKYLDKILNQILSFWQMSSEFVTAESNCKELEINCVNFVLKIFF